MNEDAKTGDIPGFMTMSDAITKKLFFQGKVSYRGRCHSKSNFHGACPSKQGDEKQQPPTEQKENKEQQDLTGANPELHQDAETPSERNEMEQNDAAPRQPTLQEDGAEATSRNGSKLESNHLSASNESQQQPNLVVQGQEVRGANETGVGNQKKETLTVIPPTPIENQRINKGKSLLTRSAQKGNENTEGATKKKKSLGRFKSGSKKRL